MSRRKNFNGQLTRRSWMVLATASLTGCGGGSDTTAGAPGTGGTGQYATLYSQGSITGFGSVIVNGVQFDDALASVQMNGVPATAADLRLGMVVAVQGERSLDATAGTASSIDVWSIAQGLVTQAFSADSGQFTVAGMTVQADSATVFDGISSAAQLTAGLRVAVWGLQTSAGGTHWRATRVAVVTVAAMVSTGLVRVSGPLREINGLAMTGALAGSLMDGQLARVQGVMSADGRSMALESLKLLGAGGAGMQPQGEIEIEGFVTSTPSASGFMLGSIEVDTRSTAYSPLGASITLGSRVEVYGVWQAGVLKASKVELEDEQALHAVEIEARIEQFTSLASFVVRGQRCDASSASLGHITAAELRVGVRVKVKGAKAGGDVLIVTELERPPN